MILDDPTSSLDNKVTSNILTTISTHPKWSKNTYIILTRKLSALRKFDRVIFMQKGAIRFFGTYSDLKLDLEFQQFEKIEGEREKQHEETIRLEEEERKKLAEIENAKQTNSEEMTEMEQEADNEGLGDQEAVDRLSRGGRGAHGTGGDEGADDPNIPTQNRRTTTEGSTAVTRKSINTKN